MARSKGTGDVVAQAGVESQSVCEAERPSKTSPPEPGTCDSVRFHGKVYFATGRRYHLKRRGYRGWSRGAPLTAGPLKVFPQAAGTSERGEAAVGSHAHAGAEMLSPHARTRERPLGTPRKALEGTWGPGQAHSQHECNHLGN